jgi:hypothetical protein
LTAEQNPVEEAMLDEEYRRRMDAMEKSLVAISQGINDLKIQGKQEVPESSLVEVPQYPNETTRSIIEGQASQLESSNYQVTNTLQKHRSIRAHAEGFLGEKVDNEDMLTRRLTLWGALEDKFDRKIAERRKLQHPTATRWLPVIITVGIIGLSGLIIYELAQPGVVAGAVDSINAFLSDPYKATWTLAFVGAIAAVAIVFLFRWRRGSSQA